MKCNSCEGLGYFEISGFCSIDVENTCPSCNGTGKQPDSSEEIREAFEKEYKDLLILDKGSSEGQYINRDTFSDFCYYESGYKSATAKAQAEIEELKGKVDDILLQENQSLKEQIKILAQITYTYNPDVDISKYLHNLSTEDYQLFIENNKIEDESRIKELEQTAVNDATMYRETLDKIKRHKCTCRNKEKP